MSFVFEGMDGYLRDNMATGMPAIVVAVDEYNDKQFVDVKPAISRLLSTGQVIGNDEITIYDVPVIWPGSGTALFSCPVEVGHTVWLSFSQRNIEDWLYSDGTQEIVPSDSRHFSMTDAVAFPGLYTALSNNHPSTDNVELKWGDKKLSFKPDDNIELTNGSATITLKPDGNIDANGCTITPDGNVITANGVNLDDFYQAYLAHTHGGVTTGSGDTDVPN